MGDFGLIDIPDGEDLTRSGKPVGSRHYTPWDQISQPSRTTPRYRTGALIPRAS